MNHNFALSALLISMVFVQCSKDKDPAPAVIISDVSPKTGQPGTIVTITGSSFSLKPEDNTVTFNGVAAEVVEATSTELVVTAPVVESSGDIEVTVSGKTSIGPEFKYYHVYCYGSKYYYAAYWIDGQPTVLTARGHIWDLAVSGADVHAVGYEVKPTEAGYFPTYWQNGVSTPLDSITPANELTGIAVSGPDVYICGVYHPNDVFSKARCWKNGHLVFSTDGTATAWASDIAASGDDFYMVGDEYPVAKVWKNGIATSLSDGTHINQATRIQIIDGDIHIVGSELYGPESASVRYWKNGNGVQLAETALPGHGLDFAILDSDLYVSGYSFRDESTYSSHAIAKLWHNGDERIISKGGGFDYYSGSIAVTDDALFVLTNQFGGSHPYWSVLLKNDTPITPDFGPGVTGAIEGFFLEYY